MREIRIVTGHARQGQNDRLDSFATIDILDQGLVIHTIGKRLADMDIREEIGRNAIAVELTGAQVGVRALCRGGNVPVLDDHILGDLRAADVQAQRLGIVGHLALTVIIGSQVELTDLADQFISLAAVGNLHGSHIGIAGLKHCIAGASFGHGLVDEALDLGKLAPVALVADKNDFLALLEALKSIWTGAVCNGGKRVAGGIHGIEVLPGLAGAIPATVLDHPILIHDGAPGLRNGRQEGAPALCQGHGHGAGGVVGHDCVDSLLTGGDQGGRISGDHALAVVGASAIFAYHEGNVIHTDAIEGLGQQPLRGGITALQQTTLEAVGNVVQGSGQRRRGT